MEIEDIINKNKEIYFPLHDFIESTDDYAEHFQNLIKFLDEQKIFQDKSQIIELLLLLSKIAVNHHRTLELTNNFERILRYIIIDKKAPISTLEIFNIFESNRHLLLYLFEKKILTPDEPTIYQILTDMNTEILSHRYYFFRAIKSFISKEKAQEIEKEIIEKYDEDIESFEHKCLVGENETLICSLIRQDLVQEFVTFISKTNMSLLSTIEPSQYETNSFLIGKKLTLIEYAAFYGSIQIFQNLQLNQVKLTDFLWICAVHSNNADMIHILERDLKLKEEQYDKVMEESIICHHNDICNFIKDNLMKPTIENQLNSNFDFCIHDSYNFYFYPSNISYIIERPKIQKGFNIANLILNLTSITIPPSVKSIGISAFSDCLSLIDVKIHSSVVSIDRNAFENCSSLKNVLLDENTSLNTIGNSAFYECSSLEQFTIPPSVTSIGYSVFYGCTSLTEISFPPSVSIIDSSAFAKCKSLKKLTVLPSIRLIRSNAFADCSSLEEVVFQSPSSLTKIGLYAFKNCTSLKEITIPNSVTKIGFNAFTSCSSLEKISILSQNIKIECNVLIGCNSLTEIEIPSSLENNISLTGIDSNVKITKH